jgi:hypothetical protein
MKEVSLMDIRMIEERGMTKMKRERNEHNIGKVVKQT